MIRLYNTLSRSKTLLKPIIENEVRIYSCGPTVYQYAHIGNMRSYLFADLLRRTLEFLGLKVKMIVNITDVGHLVGDEDEGEDKMLVASGREGKSAYTIAEFYTNAFFRDMDLLHIQRASVYPRATQHITEQIEMIQKIEKNGFTYRTSDAVYFDTSKLATYGRLSGQKIEEKMAGARVDSGEKKHGADFALWKFTPQGHAKREMEWDSPWGVGFPGWHIECSAMSKKYLGVPFDIHTGGIDHIPVHHENELAQTQAADQVLEAHIWMHNEFVTVDGGKMAKSLQNFFTLDDIIAKGYDPLSYRYLCFLTHYRQPLHFTWESLNAAEQGLTNFFYDVLMIREMAEKKRENTSTNGEFLEQIDATKQSFSAALADDLNMPKALGVVFELLRVFRQLDSDRQNEHAQRLYSFLLECDLVFGFTLEKCAYEKLPEQIHALLMKRDDARNNAYWEQADHLRKEIESQGFRVEDVRGGMSKAVKIKKPFG